MIKPISKEEIAAAQIEGNLPDKPSQASLYGGKTLTSQEIKAWYDKLPKLVAERLNNLIRSIPGVDRDKLSDDSLAAEILTAIRDGHTLKDLFTDITDGTFAEYLKLGDDQTLGEFYSTLYNRLPAPIIKVNEDTLIIDCSMYDDTEFILFTPYVNGRMIPLYIEPLGDDITFDLAIIAEEFTEEINTLAVNAVVNPYIDAPTVTYTSSDMSNTVIIERLSGKVAENGQAIENLKGNQDNLYGITDDLNSEFLSLEESVREHKHQINSLEATAINHDKRLTNLEKGLPSERFVTDSTIAYSKSVPANACPYAMIEKVGGMSHKSKNLWDSSLWLSEKTNKGVTVKYLPEEDCYMINGVLAAGQSPVLKVYKNITIAPNTRYSMTTIYVSGSYQNAKYAHVYTGRVLNGASGNWFSVSLPSSGTNSGGKSSENATTIDSVWFYLQADSVNDAVFNNYKVKIQLEQSDTHTEYEPWYDGVKHTKVTAIESIGEDFFAIPKAVQELDGYGMGLNETDYNGIEWRDGNEVWYVQRVAQDASGNVYALPEAIETEIDDLITTDNFIEVEGNGTLVFVNEDGKAVPSKIVYQVRGEA